MTIGIQGENLIFLISQSRAGSTLTQRLLGRHSLIHTVPEPWLMLHSIYGMRTNGHSAEYNADWADRARQRFLKELPCGEDDYIEGIRRMAVFLYQRALVRTNKNFFLDKTPRYFLIIPTLLRVFPRAKFVILLRNPLSVLCSMANSWSLWALHQYELDIRRAPDLLLQGINIFGQGAIVVHYEQLVMEPQQVLRNMCAYLDIDFEEEMIGYGSHNLDYWTLGDQVGIIENTEPDPSNVDRWMLSLKKPQLWRIANEYLQYLGADVVEKMGYSFDEMQSVLDNYRPSRFRLRYTTFSLDRLLRRPASEIYSWRPYAAEFTKAVRRL